jgi:hypothetical protein
MLFRTWDFDPAPVDCPLQYYVCNFYGVVAVDLTERARLACGERIARLFE